MFDSFFELRSNCLVLVVLFFINMRNLCNRMLFATMRVILLKTGIAKIFLTFEAVLVIFLVMLFAKWQ